MDNGTFQRDFEIPPPDELNSIAEQLIDELLNLEVDEKVESGAAAQSVDPANLDISQSLHSEIVTEEKQINPEVEAGQGKKRFACPECRNSFGRKWDLNRHLMIHSGEKPYQCEFCGVAFRRQSHLNDHLKIHSDEKPYKCEFCDKTFRQRAHLNEHLKIHTDEKPYKCEICDKSFRQRAYLNDHVNIHTGKWRYTCQICGSGFNHPSHLKTHSKTHTDLESNSTLTNNSGNESPKAGPSGFSSKQNNN